MRKIWLLLLCGMFMFSVVSCNRNDPSEETDGAGETTAPQYTFISDEEKCTWKSKLTAILSKTEIHDDDEPGIPGSFAVGLMDLDFDHSPEVLAAYAGGSIMRLWGKTYG